MALVCLPKFAADAFRGKLTSGEIDPQKLAGISSAERRAYFETFLSPEEAKFANTGFESKLLLKNQQEGMITWAKNLAGLKPEVQRDIITRIEKLQKALDPTDKQAFLADLAERKLGIGVTAEEAHALTTSAREVQQLKAQDPHSIEYGRARVAFDNLLSDLKNDASKVKLSDFKDNPLGTLKDVTGKVLGSAKSIKSSLDNSAIGRQGLKTLATHPTIWAKNAAKSFVDLVRTFGGKEVLNEVKAEAYASENYDLYRKMKLAIGNTEEAFPNTLAEKIPGVGRAFKASDQAFTAFQYRTRMDLADMFLEMSKKSGRDISDKAFLEPLGKFVNSMTGRGNLDMGVLGNYEGAANAINNVFFSPRYVKSLFDTFTHPITGAGGSNFVRMEATKNLMKFTLEAAAVYIIANELHPGSVQADPRSSDFGQIKIGDTRFDVTGGMRSVATLASRIATHSTVNSKGKEVDLFSGKFGAKEGRDVIYDFIGNKFSPPLSAFYDYFVQGQDKNFQKATVLGELKNTFEPLPIANYEELRDDPNSANIIVAMIADGLGITTNTYGSGKPKSSSSSIRGFLDSLKK